MSQDPTLETAAANAATNAAIEQEVATVFDTTDMPVLNYKNLSYSMRPLGYTDVLQLSNLVEMTSGNIQQISNLYSRYRRGTQPERLEMQEIAMRLEQGYAAKELGNLKIATITKAVLEPDSTQPLTEEEASFIKDLLGESPTEAEAQEEIKAISDSLDGITENVALGESKITEIRALIASKDDEAATLLVEGLYSVVRIVPALSEPLAKYMASVIQEPLSLIKNPSLFPLPLVRQFFFTFAKHPHFEEVAEELKKVQGLTSPETPTAVITEMPQAEPTDTTQPTE